jgi:hypothetical protein
MSPGRRRRLIRSALLLVLLLAGALWLRDRLEAADGAARRARTPFQGTLRGGELQRIDLASGKARTLLRTGGAMRHLVGHPEGARLYADDMGTNEAFVVDLASERVRRLAAGGGGRAATHRVELAKR